MIRDMLVDISRRNPIHLFQPIHGFKGRVFFTLRLCMYLGRKKTRQIEGFRNDFSNLRMDEADKGPHMPAVLFDRPRTHATSDSQIHQKFLNSFKKGHANSITGSRILPNLFSHNVCYVLNTCLRIGSQDTNLIVLKRTYMKQINHSLYNQNIRLLWLFLHTCNNRQKHGLKMRI